MSTNKTFTGLVAALSIVFAGAVAAGEQEGAPHVANPPVPDAEAQAKTEKNLKKLEVQTMGDNAAVPLEGVKAPTPDSALQEKTTEMLKEQNLDPKTDMQ